MHPKEGRKAGESAGRHPVRKSLGHSACLEGRRPRGDLITLSSFLRRASVPASAGLVFSFDIL